MDTSLVITTINKANKNINTISKKTKQKNWEFIVIGDKKTPKNFKIKYGKFYDLHDQKKLNFSFSNYDSQGTVPAALRRSVWRIKLVDVGNSKIISLEPATTVNANEKVYIKQIQVEPADLKLNIKEDELYPKYVTYLESKKLSNGSYKLSLISKSAFTEFVEQYQKNPDFKNKIDRLINYYGPKWFTYFFNRYHLSEQFNNILKSLVNNVNLFPCLTFF